MARGRHLLGLTGAALGASVAVLGLLWTGPWAAWRRGEVDAAGHRVWSPPYPVATEALAAIDFADVHGRLWPSWLLAASEGDGDAAFAELRGAVAGDANLVALLEDIGRFEDDPVARGDQLLHRAWAWNRYLDDAGVPWHLSLTVQRSGGAPFVYAKTYEVLSESRTQVGDDDFRTRVLARRDGTNVVEAWLGTTPDHEEGALVVVDRLATWTLDEIWTLLDPELDPLQSPVPRAFAPAIREQVEAALPPAAFATLVGTAADRFWMAEAVRSIHGRHLCGSRFVVGELPFGGLAPADLASVRRFAAGTAGSACPDVTERESVVLAVRSDHLRGTPELEPALEALLGWSTRVIVAHEARHAADFAAFGSAPPPCAACPDAPVVGIQELSAYLTSFAHEDLGPLALYQACGLEAEQDSVRAEVIAWLTDRLGTSCEAAPPPDLADRARRLEQELFGRGDVVSLDPAFPRSLPVRSASSGAAPPGREPAAQVQLDAGGADRSTRDQ